LIEVEQPRSRWLFRLNPEKQQAAGALLKAGRKE
jgi:hypothetical protein